MNMKAPCKRGVLAAARPALAAAAVHLEIAATTCVIGAVVGEWTGSNQGLGALIIQSTFNYQSDRLYAAIVLSSGLSIVLFCLVVLIERRAIKY